MLQLFEKQKLPWGSKLKNKRDTQTAVLTKTSWEWCGPCRMQARWANGKWWFTFKVTVFLFSGMQGRLLCFYPHNPHSQPSDFLPATDIGAWWVRAIGKVLCTVTPIKLINTWLPFLICEWGKSPQEKPWSRQAYCKGFFFGPSRSPLLKDQRAGSKKIQAFTMGREGESLKILRQSKQ